MDFSELKGTCGLDVNSGKNYDPRYLDVSSNANFKLSLAQIEQENGIEQIKMESLSKLESGTFSTYFTNLYSPLAKVESAKINMNMWARSVLEYKQECQSGPDMLTKESIISLIDKNS